MTYFIKVVSEKAKPCVFQTAVRRQNGAGVLSAIQTSCLLAFFFIFFREKIFDSFPNVARIWPSYEKNVQCSTVLVLLITVKSALLLLKLPNRQSLRAEATRTDQVLCIYRRQIKSLKKNYFKASISFLLFSEIHHRFCSLLVIDLKHSIALFPAIISRLISSPWLCKRVCLFSYRNESSGSVSFLNTKLNKK